MRKLNYTRCCVICHGLSELQIAKYIKSKLHLNIETHSRDSGRSSIQITSLMSFLNTKEFLNVKKYSDERGIEYNKKKLINFKLFIIMDTDDCTIKQKNDFLNKEMFKEHPLYEYIVPINNSPELETVLVKAGIMTKRIKTDEKGSYYIKTFPISSEPFSEETRKEIISFRDKLINVKETNMEEFITYCLELLDD